MNTGENEQGLRKIIDLTRLVSITILILHCYYYCYRAFDDWQLTSIITDRILKNIAQAGLFQNFNKAKLIALGFLMISLIGATGKKEEKLSHKTGFIYISSGLIIYFFSYYILLSGLFITTKTVAYIGINRHRVFTDFNWRKFIVKGYKKEVK